MAKFRDDWNVFRNVDGHSNFVKYWIVIDSSILQKRTTKAGNNVNNLVSNTVSNLAGNNVAGNNVAGNNAPGCLTQPAYNINDLNDSMNVLSNSDNSLADIVNTNNRNSRKNIRNDHTFILKKSNIF